MVFERPRRVVPTDPYRFVVFERLRLGVVPDRGSGTRSNTPTTPRNPHAGTEYVQKEQQLTGLRRRENIPGVSVCGVLGLSRGREALGSLPRDRRFCATACAAPFCSREASSQPLSCPRLPLGGGIGLEPKCADRAPSKEICPTGYRFGIGFV